MQNDASMFYNDMQTKMLLPTISRPTRITSSSSTLIDNIFVNKLNNFKSGIFTIDISDHLPIFIKYDNYFDTDKIPPKQIRYRVMNETTLNNFYQKFSMIDTTQLMIETDINEALIKLDNKIMECYNECCPIKTKIISSKDQIKPWINQSIKNNIVKRQNNYKLYQQGLISER